MCLLLHGLDLGWKKSSSSSLERGISFLGVPPTDPVAADESLHLGDLEALSSSESDSPPYLPPEAKATRNLLHFLRACRTAAWSSSLLSATGSKPNRRCFVVELRPYLNFLASTLLHFFWRELDISKNT